MPEIKINVEKECFEDGIISIMLDCDEYHIYASGISFEEAFREFGADLDMAVMHYALAPDECLHKSAIELKNKLMALMEIKKYDE